MLIPSLAKDHWTQEPSLSRRVNANSQLSFRHVAPFLKLIKKGEC